MKPCYDPIVSELNAAVDDRIYPGGKQLDGEVVVISAGRRTMIALALKQERRTGRRQPLQRAKVLFAPRC